MRSKHLSKAPACHVPDRLSGHTTHCLPCVTGRRFRRKANATFSVHDSVPLFYYTRPVRRERSHACSRRPHTPARTGLRKPSRLRHHPDACYHRANHASSQFHGGENAFQTFSRTECNVRYSPSPTSDSGPTPGYIPRQYSHQNHRHFRSPDEPDPRYDSKNLESDGVPSE